jgi:hypothetical protein
MGDRGANCLKLGFRAVYSQPYTFLARLIRKGDSRGENRSDA